MQTMTTNLAAGKAGGAFYVDELDKIASLDSGPRSKTRLTAPKRDGSREKARRKAQKAARKKNRK